MLFYWGLVVILIIGLALILTLWSMREYVGDQAKRSPEPEVKPIKDNQLNQPVIPKTEPENPEITRLSNQVKSPGVIRGSIVLPKGQKVIE